MEPALISTLATVFAILYLLFRLLSLLSDVSNRNSTEMRIEKLSAAYTLHTAETVLKNCQATGIPYAVYLRNFSIEREAEPLILQILGGKRKPQVSPARKVEELLLAKIGGLMPVLALSDPSNPFPIAGFYRFRRLGTYWEDFLESPLKDSSLIIIYLAGDSSGLVKEMKLIREMGLFNKVLLIIGNNENWSDSTEHLWEFKSIVFEKDRFFNEALDKSLNTHLKNIPGMA
jgi:hypothetical protein